ncbi:MAG: metal-dependent hydrolase [Magnetococcus sp. DMHC-6]
MANFRVHLSVATLVSGLAATSLLVAGRIGKEDTLICFVAGLVGGILPDIDADHSEPLQLAFTFSALLVGFMTLFKMVDRLAVLELLLLFLFIFLFIKIIIYELFVRFTVHRGIFHSLPAGAFFAFLMMIWLHKEMGFTPHKAWFVGLFVVLGYLVHLLLDEVYSLNILGAGGVKHSFGTAFKLFSSNLLVTGLMYGAVVVLFFWLPDSGGVWTDLFGRETRMVIEKRFYPDHGWFKF